MKRKYNFLFLIVLILILTSCLPRKDYFVIIVVTPTTPEATVITPPNTLTPKPSAFDTLNVTWNISQRCTTGGELKDGTVELIISGGALPYDISPNPPFSIHAGQVIDVVVQSQDGQTWVGKVLAPTCKDETPTATNSPTITSTSTRTPSPTIAVTLTPTATPTVPAFSTYSGKLSLDNINLGSYSIDAPRTIVLGDSSIIKARVDFEAFFLPQIKEGAEKENATQTEIQNVSYRITVGSVKGLSPSIFTDLVITNFDSDENSISQKSLLSNAEFIWTWSIAPQKLGNQKVSLVFIMPVNDSTGDSQVVLGEKQIDIYVSAPNFTPTPMLPLNQRLGDAFIEKFPDLIGYILSFVAAILVLFFKDEITNKREEKQSTSKNKKSETSKPRKRETKKTKTDS